jgi:hypothetical protein
MTIELSLPESLVHLERQLAGMRELAASLQRAQGCVLHGEITGLEEETRHQQQLCAWLQDFEQAPANDLPSPERRTAAASLPEQWRGRWQMVGLELAAVENQVRHLNRVHAAILRRARQSLVVLSQIVASCGPTYEVKSAPLVGGGK